MTKYPEGWNKYPTGWQKSPIDTVVIKGIEETVL